MLKSDFRAASTGELSTGTRPAYLDGWRRASVMATFAPILWPIRIEGGILWVVMKDSTSSAMLV